MKMKIGSSPLKKVRLFPSLRSPRKSAAEPDYKNIVTVTDECNGNTDVILAANAEEANIDGLVIGKKESSEEAKEDETDADKSTPGDKMEVTPNTTKPDDSPLPRSSGSPKCHFEFDNMNATQENIDSNRLHKGKSYSLSSMMDGDETVRSEGSISKSGETISGESILSRVSSFPYNRHGEVGVPAFVEDVLSPISEAAESLYSKLKCDFPDMVDDVNEFLSKDLHHAFYKGDDDNELLEEATVTTVNDVDVEEEEQEKRERKQGDATEAEKEEKNEGLEIVLSPDPSGTNNGEQEGGDRGDSEEADEEGGKEVMVIDGKKCSEDVEVESVLGRLKWESEVMQSRYNNASYSPATGFLFTKMGMRQLTEEEVFVRVDATTLSKRDCLERLRRDTNKELGGEMWVPGQEIVGHVVHSGTEEQSLMGKRIAALLPSGGGCSQYVCVRAKDVVVVPDETSRNDNEVVALLSTYLAAFQCLECVSESEQREDDSVASTKVSRMESVEEEEEEEDDGSKGDIESIGDENVESNVGVGEVESKEVEVIVAVAEDEHVKSERDDVESESQEKAAESPVDDKETNDGVDAESKKEEEDEDVDLKEAVDLKEKDGNITGSEIKKGALSFMKVLITDADSPVGCALVDLLMRLHAGSVIYTLTKNDDLSTVRELGATRCNELSKKKKWENEWRGEIDLIIDTIGDMDYNPSFYRVMTTRGRLARLHTTVAERDLDTKALSKSFEDRVVKDKTIVDYDVFNSFNDDKDLFEEDLTYLLDLLKVSSIGPKYMHQVGFEELEEEWSKLMKAGDDMGSTVTVVSPWKVGFSWIV